MKINRIKSILFNCHYRRLEKMSIRRFVMKGEKKGSGRAHKMHYLHKVGMHAKDIGGWGIPDIITVKTEKYQNSQAKGATNMTEEAIHPH